MSPWYVEFFRGDYQAVFRDAQDPERSETEAAFALRALGLRGGERVLDLCCGAGRHLEPLRARGLRAIGVDLHLDSIRGARAACADMRALPLRTGRADAVVSFFSSFGYLESDEQDEHVVREIGRVLRPGGGLFLDLLHREHALAGFAADVQRVEPDGTLVVERRSWDALRSRLSVGFVVAPPAGEQREFAGHSLRLYTLTEIDRLLERNGLELEAVYGGYDGSACALDSPRMICLARRHQR